VNSVAWIDLTTVIPANYFGAFGTIIRPINVKLVILLTFVAAHAGVISGLASQVLPNPASAYTVQIKAGTPAEPIGSGFLLHASNSVYLATARHVLFHKAETGSWELLFPAIAVSQWCRPSPTNEQQVCINIDLQTLKAASEVRCANEHDVALVRIEDCLPTNSVLTRYLPGASGPRSGCAIGDNLLRTSLELDAVGADVFLFGFPSSIGLAQVPQLDHSRPLLRKGIIAAINEPHGTIVLDCPVYQGNSGGPVVMKEQVSFNSAAFQIIGIAVESVPFQDVWENKRFGYRNETWSNSGYSIVERAEHILTLVWR
jgi:hypothetical protein